MNDLELVRRVFEAPGFVCECNSFCTLSIEVPDSIINQFPLLFESDDIQFIVNGCEEGPIPGMEILYEEKDFQIYQRKE